MSARARCFIQHSICCSCPRVDAPNNTTDKAEGVQRYYTDRGKDIVVVTIAGKGIKVRFSVDGEWLHQPKGHTIGMVLEAIDHDERGGLKTPVAVFGYTKMRRGGLSLFQLTFLSKTLTFLVESRNLI